MVPISTNQCKPPGMLKGKEVVSPAHLSDLSFPKLVDPQAIDQVTYLTLFAIH